MTRLQYSGGDGSVCVWKSRRRTGTARRRRGRHRSETRAATDGVPTAPRLHVRTLDNGLRLSIGSIDVATAGDDYDCCVMRRMLSHSWLSGYSSVDTSMDILQWILSRYRSLSLSLSLSLSRSLFSSCVCMCLPLCLCLSVSICLILSLSLSLHVSVIITVSVSVSVTVSGTITVSVYLCLCFCFCTSLPLSISQYLLCLVLISLLFSSPLAIESTIGSTVIISIRCVGASATGGLM